MSEFNDFSANCEQKMEGNDQLITRRNLEVLIRHAVKNTYRTRCTDTVSEGFLQNCLSLFSKDYKFSIIDNSWGELCGHYPTKIVVLEHLLKDEESDEPPTDVAQLRDLIIKSRIARCRSRFVVPVILFDGKHICRSSTLASGPEMYSRQFYNMMLGGSADAFAQPTETANNANSSDWQMFSRVRAQDILLLKRFNVGFIIDLMVEKKKVKYGMNVTSSEKVDKENRYSEFGIASIPFPGCEFFKDWKDNGYRTKGLSFDWTQGFVDASLDLPTYPPPVPNIDWQNYKEWNIVTLTQNYLKLILSYLRQADTGFLIHCISGWDRTPMFVSLVRLSLWSEGLVHPTLAPHEILYLTITYDWYLFGHNFPDRLYKGEDVFYFCFSFLKYITDDEFNLMPKIPVHAAQAESRTIFEEELEPELLSCRCTRGSNTSINSMNSNGCSDNATASDDETTTLNNSVELDHLSSTMAPPHSRSLYHTRSSPCNHHHNNGISNSDNNISIKNDSISTDDSVFQAPDNNQNSQQQLHPDERFHSESHPRPSNVVMPPVSSSCAGGPRNSDPVPVPSPPVINVSEMMNATPHSYGSWQMVGSNELENMSAFLRRSSITETFCRHSCHMSERKQKLIAVRNLFMSIYKQTLTENNSGIGLGNLLESLFGTYKNNCS